MRIGLPATARRVELCTKSKVNKKIHRASERKLKLLGEFSDRKGLTAAIQKLDREWDTERVLEANAAALTAAATVLTLKKGRVWSLLSGAVSFFLMAHALIGWCPPLPVIRRLGVRTPKEIQNEKMELKAIRGDFNGLPEKKTLFRTVKIMRAVEKE